MNTRIWKFNLDVTDYQSILLPAGAEILSVQTQLSASQSDAQGVVKIKEDICLWALVNPAAEPVKRDIAIYGTGNPISGNPGKFIGTVQMGGGALIFHVFDVSEG